MNLTGEIPSELGTIEDLALLSLYGNVLEHTIPSQLGRLQYLQKIDFGKKRYNPHIELYKRCS